MTETTIGKVNHYFDKISVAVVDLIGPIRLGDTIAINGKHTDFVQRVTSMQIGHENIETACAGQEVAIKVIERARAGDMVLRAE